VTALPSHPDLVTITAPGGARFTVARAYQPQFQGLIDYLAQHQYAIDPGTSGGFNPRMIAGTNTPSEHSYGRAIDVNWSANPRGGTPFNLPPELAREAARRFGMTWGGDWTGKTQDPMHFEIARAPVQANAQREVAIATPPVPPGAVGGNFPLSSGPPVSGTSAGQDISPGLLALLSAGAGGIPGLPNSGSSLSDMLTNAVKQYRQSTAI